MCISRTVRIVLANIGCEVDMQTIHRVTFFITQGSHKDDPPTNLFVFAKDNQEAIQVATALYQEEMKKFFPTEPSFRAEVFRSSQREVEEFVAAVRAGHRTQEVVN